MARSDTYLPESNSYRCPAGGAAELRRVECSQSCPCLYRQRQTLRSLLAKKRNAQVDDINTWPSTCMSRPDSAHANWPTRPSSPGKTPAKENRGLVCGTQESDRIASLTSAEIEVRAGAVLPSSGGSEYQTTCAVPEPTNKPCSARHGLAEATEENLGGAVARR